METFVREFAGFGPVFLMVAWVMFLLRGQLIDLIRGGSSDTSRLIKAMEEMTRALDKQTQNFEHNNRMFTAITKEAGQMVVVLHDIKDEIIRGTK